jgi:hypothetical protein
LFLFYLCEDELCNTQIGVFFHTVQSPCHSGPLLQAICQSSYILLIPLCGFSDHVVSHSSRGIYVNVVAGNC